jgi:DNA ligase (NAD+)
LVAAGVNSGLGSGAAGSLHGKVFVFTGSLPFLSRVEAVAKVLAAGGEVRDSVSGRIDFLVAGEGAGRKLVVAEARGVRVIDAAEFKRMVGME